MNTKWRFFKFGNSLKISAEEEIRTLTPFRALPPQSSASTNFATSAIFKANANVIKYSRYKAESIGIIDQ
jgi:hypothetical protein